MLCHFYCFYDICDFTSRFYVVASNHQVETCLATHSALQFANKCYSKLKILSIHETSIKVIFQQNYSQWYSYDNVS